MLSGDDGELGRFFMHTPLESVEHGRPATKADAEPRAKSTAALLGRPWEDDIEPSIQSFSRRFL
jgi:hypothetical protein